MGLGTRAKGDGIDAFNAGLRRVQCGVGHGWMDLKRGEKMKTIVRQAEV
jgi:hypothetical protein